MQTKLFLLAAAFVAAEPPVSSFDLKAWPSIVSHRRLDRRGLFSLDFSPYKFVEDANPNLSIPSKDRHEHLAVVRRNGQKYLMKYLKKRNAKDAKITREAKMLEHATKAPQHDGIVKYIAKVETNDVKGFVQEYSRGGTLNDLILAYNLRTPHTPHSPWHLKESEAKHIFYQVASALNNLHTFKDLAHCNINFNTIAIFPDTPDQSLWGRMRKGQSVQSYYNLSVKLTNFANAEFISKPEPGIEQRKLLTYRYGVYEFKAPELFYHDGGILNVAALDVWSLGAALFYSLFGVKIDYFNKVAGIANLLNQYSSNAIQKLKEPLRSLMEALLNPDPATRISMSCVLSHPWFADCESYEPKSVARELCNGDRLRLLNQAPHNLCSYQVGQHDNAQSKAIAV